ncbi:hypothetical protein [Acinetobacter sp. YH12239]|uniref:hypothetical protein n=1 Tax=Acinetobacter sp. YH12239 TaxID=2601166 RepID=UPI0015D2DEC4|nr:hypothetical protein [Acinetobacter sp. YH12239]
MIKTFIAKFYEAVIIALTAFLLLTLIGLGIQSWRVSHWQNKFNGADAECVERINKVNEAYQSALEAWKAKVFIVENELEAERNNIKIEFRDIRHETQKIITDRIYTDCKFTDDGLRIAQTAIATANSSKPIN